MRVYVRKLDVRPRLSPLLAAWRCLLIRMLALAATGFAAYACLRCLRVFEASLQPSLWCTTRRPPSAAMPLAATPSAGGQSVAAGADGRQRHVVRKGSLAIAHSRWARSRSLTDDGRARYMMSVQHKVSVRRGGGGE